MKKWLVLHLSLLVLSIGLSAQASPEPVYSGEIPCDEVWTISSATLSNDGRAVVLASTRDWKTVALRLVEGELQRVGILDIRQPMVGDVDGDGNDELISVNRDKASVFTWQEDSYKQKTYKLGGSVYQSIVGDIDNDGRAELVAFFDRVIPANRPSDYPGYLFKLGIWEPAGDSFIVAWHDNGALGFENSGVIPPDRLQFIEDIDNDGARELLIRNANSDVSPSGYRTLCWNGKELTISGTTVFADSTFEDPLGKISLPIDRDRAFVWGITPFKWKGRTKLAASLMIDRAMNIARVTGEVVDGTLNVEEVLEVGKQKPDSKIERYLFLDLDGKGEGVFKLHADRKAWSFSR